MIGRGFFQSTFFRNVLTLTTGTTIAQVIPVLLQPLLRRLYTPEEYGIFATYLSVTNILIVFASLRYEAAVVLPKEDKEASHLVHLGLLLNILINGLLYILILIFRAEIMGLLDIPERFGFVLYLIPIGIFLFGTYQNLNYWLIRKQAFKASSINKVVRRGSEGVAQGGLAAVSTTSGLFLGDIIGKLLLNLTCLFQASKKGFSFGFSLSGMKSIARRYQHFPIYYAIPSLMDTASLMLPVIFINRFYASSTTGHVDLTMQVLAIPLALISAAVSQVLFQRISERRNAGQPIFRNVKLVLGSLFFMAGFAVVVIVFFAPELFSFIFGDEWEVSGHYSRVLIFGYAARFVISPLSIVLTALEKLKRVAIWQALYFTGIIMLTLFGGKDIMTFLTIWMTIDVVAYGLYLGIILYSAKKYDQSLS